VLWSVLTGKGRAWRHYAGWRSSWNYHNKGLNFGSSLSPGPNYGYWRASDTTILNIDFNRIQPIYARDPFCMHFTLFAG
jgi:hypothetical protein